MGGQVGKATVRDFIEVVARESHSGGLMLASGGYSGDAASALSELERRTVRLGARAKIVSLCKTYVKAERGSGRRPQ
jgi:restriction system protein